jgi:hypothetical protein
VSSGHFESEQRRHGYRQVEWAEPIELHSVTHATLEELAPGERSVRQAQRTKTPRPADQSFVAPGGGGVFCSGGGPDDGSGSAEPAPAPALPASASSTESALPAEVTEARERGGSSIGFIPDAATSKALGFA